MAVCYSYRYDSYRTPKEVVWLQFEIRPAELTFIDPFIHKKQSSEGIVSSESLKKRDFINSLPAGSKTAY